VKPEMTNERDQALGMGAKITRRDFLNGVALTVGAAAILPRCGRRPRPISKRRTRPLLSPAKTGLRGSHVGSFETMHKVPTAIFGRAAPKPSIRVNPTIWSSSAEASAIGCGPLFSQAAGDKARILILENHDDFGGHAKRNEFRAGSRHDSRVRRHVFH